MKRLLYKITMKNPESPTQEMVGNTVDLTPNGALVISTVEENQITKGQTKSLHLIIAPGEWLAVNTEPAPAHDSKVLA